MLQLGKNSVKLGVSISTKEEAINEVGQLLLESGYIEEGYIKSLFGREDISNTYLGNGICIPHGLQENRELILKTGIAVLQIPNGVIWKDGEKAHIVVGIAAKTDEHIQILAQLTNLLSDEEEAKKLAITKDVNDILNALNSEAVENSDSSVNNVEVFEINKEVIFNARAGFHARPATVFVDIANKFKSEIRLKHNGKFANGRSMAAILRLGISGGSSFVISTEGEDEKLALEELCKAVEDGLNEKPEEAIEKTIAKREYFGKHFEGVPASPGMAIGPIVILNEDEIQINKEGKDAHSERNKLRDAFEKAISELNHWLHQKHEKVDEKRMDIFIAHLGLLKDPELQEKALKSIKDGISATYSWWEVIKEEEKSLSALNDIRLSQRAIDIKDIGKRVLKFLDSSAIKSDNIKLNEKSILVAKDMTPSETSQLDKSKVLALVTVKGGSTSHTAILARSMGIPSIAGVNEEILTMASSKAIADGDSGILVLNPTSKDLDLAYELEKR